MKHAFREINVINVFRKIRRKTSQQLRKFVLRYTLNLFSPEFIIKQIGTVFLVDAYLRAIVHSRKINVLF